MNTLKKYIPFAIAFALGSWITYLTMVSSMKDLHMKWIVMKQKLEQQQDDPKQQVAEQKHWFDERMEQEAEAYDKRIRDLETEGDALKSQFDEFSGKEGE